MAQKAPLPLEPDPSPRSQSQAGAVTLRASEGCAYPVGSAHSPGALLWDAAHLQLGPLHRLWAPGARDRPALTQPAAQSMCGALYSLCADALPRERQGERGKWGEA